MSKFERCIRPDAQPLDGKGVDELHNFYALIETARREVGNIEYLLSRKWLLNGNGYRALGSIRRRLSELDDDVVDIINVLDKRDII